MRHGYIASLFVLADLATAAAARTEDASRQGSERPCLVTDLDSIVTVARSKTEKAVEIQQGGFHAPTAVIATVVMKRPRDGGINRASAFHWPSPATLARPSTADN